MVKAIEFLIEAIYWLTVFLSPTFGFGAIALILYANDVEKVDLSILITAIGIVSGIVLAERIRRKYGCSNYIGRILSTPDIQPATKDKAFRLEKVDISKLSQEEQLERLFFLLDKAEKLAAEFSGGWSDHFFSTEEFHAALVQSINEFKAGKYEEISTLYVWFAPTYDWDDFVGGNGVNLGNEVFELLGILKQSLLKK